MDRLEGGQCVVNFEVGSGEVGVGVHFLDVGRGVLVGVHFECGLEQFVGGNVHRLIFAGVVGKDDANNAVVLLGERGALSCCATARGSRGRETFGPAASPGRFLVLSTNRKTILLR